METHTPITYWLSMPWVRARVWEATVAKIQADDREKVARR